ncbi:major capsid protein [Rhodococcus zopfii]|uniref:major capsid protein n=1 Tax=Rhodococcus zopfii TaxID=43772 RepID=UPI0011115D0E|nr:major capsid protein [Rhodococcus zopfii]
MNPLVPNVTDNVLTLSAHLNNPSRVTQLVAKRAGERLIAPTFFADGGSSVSGGGVLHSVMRPGDDFATRDPEHRAPGSEYVILTTDELKKMAAIDNVGGKIGITDEEIRRSETATIRNKIEKLSNSVVAALDRITLAAVLSSLADNAVAPVPAAVAWDALVLNGDPAEQTLNASKPTATFAAAQALADTDDLGVTYDTLVVGPVARAALATAYAEQLGAMLESAGLTLKVTPYLTGSDAILVQSGQVGTLYQEVPFAVEVIQDRTRGLTWYQAAVYPAVAVSNPFAARLVTGVTTTTP